MRADATVVHAYGVVEAAAAFTLPATGILGAAVTRSNCGGYAVIASTHAESELGEHVWTEQGQDPQWIGPIAAQHHEVLQGLVGQVDVLPLRLPGMYHDETSMCRALEASIGGLQAAFDIIRGHVEWGVQVFSRPGEAGPPTTPRPTSGRDYLNLRARSAAQQDESRERRNAVLLGIHEALALAATHATLNPPQDRALTGRSEQMLLNGAYLVARTGQERFFELVSEQAGQHETEGYLLELSGPWPPYNFTQAPARSAGTT